MAHIIIIGAGLGGVPAAYEMRQRLGGEHQVSLVSETPDYRFVPSNPWVAVGWRKGPEICQPLAEPMARRGIDFVHGRVTHIDAEGQALTLDDGRTLAWDYLVVATGPRLAFDEVPGLGPEAHSHSICTLGHAQQAWEDYQAFIRNPGPVVIGAAPGASCFGPAYEFALILDADLRKRKLRHRVPMTYVTPEPYIGHMGLGGVGDSKGLLEGELRQRHIKWITNARIEAVTADEVRYARFDEAGSEVDRGGLAKRFAMILPAFTGVEPVAAVPGLCNPRGFVLVDEHQRSPAHPRIFSLGVCIAIPPIEATPVPTGAPKTGYMIESMVSAVVHNIEADLAGEPATARASWNAICLADMGDTGVAFVALPQIPPRNVTWARKGRWVHLAKIAFEKYFLRKVRVGNTDPIYERIVLRMLGIQRLDPG